MNIEDISLDLLRNTDGIYLSNAKRKLSYAANGHEECFQVEDRSFWFRHRNDCIANLIRAHPFSGTLLDIGGGNGFVGERLIRDGHDVVLLEPGMNGAINAHARRGIENVVCATVEDAHFRPGSFGALGLFDVIEHIDNDSKFLDSTSSLLSTTGKLYLTVPCHQWLWSTADIDAGHYRRHTLKSLRRLLEPRFRIDFMSYFFGPLVLPQLLFRSVPYRLRLNRRKSLLSNQTEHAASDGIAAKAITKILDHEITYISSARNLPFGASAIVAATLT